jgi:hypothetical protein
VLGGKGRAGREARTPGQGPGGRAGREKEREGEGRGRAYHEHDERQQPHLSGDPSEGRERVGEEEEGGVVSPLLDHGCAGEGGGGWVNI